MLRLRIVVFLVLAVCAGGESFAQQRQANGVTDRGVWIGGRYFGHNPSGTVGDGYASDLAEPARYAEEPASYQQHACECCETGCCVEDACCGELIGCGDCCRPKRPRFYAGAEYVYGWTRGVELPELVTTSTAGTVQADAGELGLNSTSVLFGGHQVNDDAQSGARITLGAYCGPCEQQSVEFIYSFFDDSADSYATSSDAFPILARPFYDVSAGEQAARLIGFGGVVSGSVSVSAQSDMASYELHLRRNACSLCGTRVDVLAGYRAVDLNDSILISESTLSLTGATNGSTFDLQDSFSTSNTFHGGQLGFAWRMHECSKWSCGCTVKTAIGTTNHKGRVSGSTTVTPTAGTPTTTQGGLLTQASNSGSYSDDEFSSVSEIGFTLRYKIKPSVALTCGYNAVFWSDVLRAGEQIDLAVNPTQIPPSTLTGEARPEFPFSTSGYWAQQVRFGVEGRF